MVDYDESYWAPRRAMEEKHFLQTARLLYFFKPQRVLDDGCGLGQWVEAFKYFGVPACGWDPSEVAVKASGKSYIFSAPVQFAEAPDLVLNFDVLEHAHSLDEAGEIVKRVWSETGKWACFFVTPVDSPNYKGDPTHYTGKTMSFWKAFIEGVTGVKAVETPSNFLWRDQFVIVKKQ